MAYLANANPTCLAAQRNIILCDPANPSGLSVFPVPVGAIYNTNFGLGFLQIVNNCF
jgi:hypothetical protein